MLGKSTLCFTVDLDWVPGSEEAVPTLLDLCDEYQLLGTYFAAGRFALEHPSLLAEVSRRGHEVGTHGWEHGLKQYEDYSTAPISEQRRWLERATRTVTAAVGSRPFSFRAPNLWVREDTLAVLEELDYRYDSSVPARRYDAGFGRLKHQLRYFLAPRTPYHPSRCHLGKRGESDIVEVPPSTYLLPMNMASLRLFGARALSWAAGRLLKKCGLLVFYVHPAEFVDYEKLSMPRNTPRRHREGVGPENFELLRAFLSNVLDLGCSSATVEQAAKGVD